MLCEKNVYVFVFFCYWVDKLSAEICGTSGVVSKTYVNFIFRIRKWYEWKFLISFQNTHEEIRKYSHFWLRWAPFHGYTLSANTSLIWDLVCLHQCHYHNKPWEKEINYNYIVANFYVLSHYTSQAVTVPNCFACMRNCKYLFRKRISSI